MFQVKEAMMSLLIWIQLLKTILAYNSNSLICLSHTSDQGIGILYSCSDQTRKYVFHVIG